MMAWDKTKPAGGEALSKGDDGMRANFAWLEMALGIPLVFPGDDITAGRSLVNRHTEASRDALTPVDRMVIVRTDKPAIEYYDAASSSWITYDFAFIGQIRQVAFDAVTAPEGWLFCDGSAVSRTTYAELFAVIGTAFGAGDGSTTFNVPNLGGRVPVGEDTGDADFDVIGETGGAKEVTLDSDELPTHDHTVSNGGEHGITGSPRSETGDAHKMPIYTGGGGSALYESALPGAADFTYPSEPTARGAHTHTVLQQADPKDGAHNNVQPYLVNDFMIFAGS